jgi:hypothetical protein
MWGEISPDRPGKARVRRRAEWRASMRRWVRRGLGWSGSRRFVGLIGISGRDAELGQGIARRRRVGRGRTVRIGLVAAGKVDEHRRQHHQQENGGEPDQTYAQAMHHDIRQMRDMKIMPPR